MCVKGVCTNISRSMHGSLLGTIQALPSLLCQLEPFPLRYRTTCISRCLFLTRVVGLLSGLRHPSVPRFLSAAPLFLQCSVPVASLDRRCASAFLLSQILDSRCSLQPELCAALLGAEKLTPCKWPELGPIKWLIALNCRITSIDQRGCHRPAERSLQGSS